MKDMAGGRVGNLPGCRPNHALMAPAALMLLQDIIEGKAAVHGVGAGGVVAPATGSSFLKMVTEPSRGHEDLAAIAPRRNDPRPITNSQESL